MNDALLSLFDMTGQVALLTGAGRGIGLSMAQTLASAGCAIALQDIDLAVAQAEVDAINRNGGKALAFGGDICDLTLPQRLVQQTIEKLGRLDVLVNNASIQTRKHWMELEPQEMETQFRADLISPILFIQQVWPIFKKQRSGRIINIGSIQQQAANPAMLAYSISKSGLEKLTEGLSVELAAENVTMNLIAPGWINTFRNRDQLTSPQIIKELGEKNVPLKRLGDPEDFRGVALLLCSAAGSYITGETIYVDGGMRW